MILNTREIIQRLISPEKNFQLSVVPGQSTEAFREQGGASIDLRLGRWFRTMRQSNIDQIDLKKTQNDTAFSEEHFVPFGEKFVLHRGKFALGITLEWLTFPGDIVGHITGKSSLGRRGLIIETAAGIQPGFAGCLTLELANVGEIPIALTPGMQICQVFLHEATSSNAGAKSQFKGSRKPGLGTIC